MKLLMFTSLILLILSSCLIAQNNDSVDVSALVKKQMFLAQQKEKTTKNTKPAVKEITSNLKLDVEQEEAGISTSAIVKLSVIFIAVFVAGGVIGKRRFKLRKIENRIKLKQNVKQLREEQLVKHIDPRLKMIRKKLCLNSNYLNKPEKEIILAARKFNIAKEEILLASRLNSYGMRENMEVTAQ